MDCTDEDTVGTMFSFSTSACLVSGLLEDDISTRFVLLYELLLLRLSEDQLGVFFFSVTSSFLDQDLSETLLSASCCVFFGDLVLF